VVDLFASILAVYSMIVATPLGGIAIQTWHWATGEKRAHRPILSYFDTEAAREERPTTEASRSGPKLEPIALHTVPPASVLAPGALPPSLARAVALVLSNGRVAEGGNFDVPLSFSVQRAIERAGIEVPPHNSNAVVRERALFLALSRLITDLGSEEAAVAALAVDPEDLQFALAMARSTGTPNAARYEAFRPFLPPASRTEVDDLVEGTFALATAYDIGWPLARTGVVTSRFGSREDPILHSPDVHHGIDISIPTGTEILAIADGRVVLAADEATNGRFVRIDHGHGLSSVYCHASKLEVHRNAYVKKGDVLALSGATGRTTGPHLHLQIEINRKPIDPEIFLPNAAYERAFGSSERTRR
jgi:hypothetical protein